MYTTKKCFCFTYAHAELEKFGYTLFNAKGKFTAPTEEMRHSLLKRLVREVNAKESLDWKVEECDVIVNADKLSKNKAVDDILVTLLLFNRHLFNLPDVILHDRVTDSERVTDEELNTDEEQDLIDKAQRFEKKGSALAEWGENLNCTCIKEGIPKYNGCDVYVDRMIQTLCRKTKSSPLLVGDKGVGKTTIVKEFIGRVLRGEVPDVMKDIVVYSINMARLVSGAKYRGDFEERLMRCLEEAAQHSEIIIFIDNLHETVGAGSVQEKDGIDGAGILMPYIADGRVSVIGTTTYNAYAHIIEKQGTLSRLFQLVNINEPTTEVACKMLHDFAEVLSKHYNVAIPNTVCDTAVMLAKRYLTNKRLPDSAIDLLDEACAKHICANKKAKLKVETIYEVISEQLGIPLSKLSESEADKLSRLSEVLSKRVIGQEQAIKSLTTAIKSSRTGLNDMTKPLGSFIFAGSTGVGKTELCKALAAELFNDEDAVVRIDMSEYMESHTVSKLIGAPKGYVGYGEGGYLTDAVAKKPYTIVLFDEIEKAHPQIMNILLQVLDDGRLTDSTGKTVDFKNTLIIMTTNIGAKKKGEDTHLGFVSMTEHDRKADFMSAIKGYYKPEFLNRIDDIIVFNKLEPETVTMITEKLLNELKVMCKSKGYDVSFDASVLEYCMENGFDAENGVRPMQHFINRNIKAELSNAILEGTLVKGKPFVLTMQDEKPCLKTMSMV